MSEEASGASSRLVEPWRMRKKSFMTEKAARTMQVFQKLPPEGRPVVSAARGVWHRMAYVKKLPADGKLEFVKMQMIFAQSAMAAPPWGPRRVSRSWRVSGAATRMCLRALRKLRASRGLGCCSETCSGSR